MSIDHDQIHKWLFEAFFREFMELFFAAEAALIDFSSVEFLREEMFTDVHSGRRRQLDLLVRVGLIGGGKKFVLIHIEFESSRRAADFPERMFQYFCQLHLRYQAEILPIAVFSDDARWRVPVPNYFEIGLAGSRVLRFDFKLIKLKHYDYQAFLNSPNPLAYALMAKMDYNREMQVRLKAEFLRLISGCGVDPARQSLLAAYVDTYMPLNVVQQTEFHELVSQDRELEMVEKLITSWEREGINKGRAEGFAEGKQQGLIFLLEGRFGPVDESVKERIRAIKSPERLEKLLLNVLKVKSLEEMGI